MAAEADDPATSGLTRRDAEEAEERARPKSPVIYEVLRREGEDEMARPAVSLWWSGVAAGLSISFSLLCQAILQTHIAESAWRPLATSLGYTVGFVIVILGRQQLFTENTITVVLPVIAEPSRRNLLRLGRLWSVVLAANLAGVVFSAVFCSFTPVLTPELRGAMLQISRETLALGWPQMFFRAISAGFLIAGMVWLLPNAGAAQLPVIVLMTWVISAGGFVHIIAGGMEASMLVAAGQASLWEMLSRFVVPALLGNVVGGSALFAVLAYAQVMQEI